MDLADDGRWRHFLDFLQRLSQVASPTIAFDLSQDATVDRAESRLIGEILIDASDTLDRSSATRSPYA